MDWLTPVITLVGVVSLAAVPLAYAHRRWPDRAEPLVDAIDRALPQTQCAQCGYPGCRPYAEAIAAGAAGIDLCPPGGAETFALLARLVPEHGGSAPAAAPGQVALIDESRCIGCALCLPACPVDAIVGAHRYLHTVITAECTGCELCLPPCPVDCIELRPLHPAAGTEDPQ